MAVCPKCGYKLKLIDVSQNCPECGTNLMFYGFAERFYREAKYAEMDLASFRVWLAKTKAAYIGGKLQIARFVAVLLPIAALLIPFGDIKISLPLFEKDVQINGLGAFGVLTDGTLGAMLNFKHSELFGASVKAASLALALFAVTALLAVAILLAQLLCFAGLKRVTVSLAAMSATGILTSVATLFLTQNIPDTGSLMTTSVNFLGPLCCITAFAIVFTLNVLLLKKGINVKYREGDIYRANMYKRYKRHEITLDELPLPIYETEAERAERERKIEETKELIAIAEGQGGAVDE